MSNYIAIFLGGGYAPLAYQYVKQIIQNFNLPPLSWFLSSDEDEYSSCSGGDYWDDEVGCYDGILPVDDLPICTCNEPCCVTPTEEEKIMLLP